MYGKKAVFAVAATRKMEFQSVYGPVRSGELTKGGLHFASGIHRQIMIISDIAKVAVLPVQFHGNVNGILGIEFVKRGVP